MHIALTDHLTCPVCGPEHGLILLADRIEERRVLEGTLGCPACRERYPIVGGLADLRPRPAGPLPGPESAPTLGPQDRAFRLAALMGVAEGPGFLLDEPTLGLDPPSRDALAALLRERADAGATVILATHDTRLAESLCDRVLLLHQGSVAAEGTPTELIRRLAPTTRVVVELRNPPRVPPTLEGARTAAATRDRLVVEAGAGTAVLPALCEALLAAGAEIASIRVREPGLAEAFLTLTGSDLDPVHR